MVASEPAETDGPELIVSFMISVTSALQEGFRALIVRYT